MAKSSKNTNLVFQYFMVGTMGAITAAGAKSTINGEFETRGWGMGNGGWMGWMVLGQLGVICDERMRSGWMVKGSRLIRAFEQSS